MKPIFVTGAGTGVGKTLLVRLAIEQLRSRQIPVHATKPVVTGFDPTDAAGSDPALLLEALRLPVDRNHFDRISPWRFLAPLSPDMAAAREQRSIPFEDLVGFCQQIPSTPVTIIEGVGGVLVPLDAEHTVADWIQALQPSTVLVTGSYLGSISHTLSAFESLQSRQIAVRSVVVSSSIDEPVAADETAETMRRFCGPVPIFVLPRLAATSAAPDVAPMLGIGD